jgi:hypothetical protein
VGNSIENFLFMIKNYLIASVMILACSIEIVKSQNPALVANANIQPQQLILLVGPDW